MSYSMSRPYTTEIFNMMNEGMITAEQVAQMCLLYMSEDEVKDMMISNDIMMADAENEVCYTQQERRDLMLSSNLSILEFTND